MPTKKKYNARFAPARIKKIMQTDEEVGKVSAAVPVLISKALEMFLDEMMKKAEQLTTSRSAKTLTVKHLKQCIMTEKRFDFLHDAVADIPDLGLEEEEEEKQPRKRRKQSEAKSKSELCEQHSSEGDQPDDVFTALIKNEAEGPCSANTNSTSSMSHSVSNSVSHSVSNSVSTSISRTNSVTTPTTPRVNSFSIDSIMSSKKESPLFPDLPTARVKKESTSEPVAALVKSEPVAALVDATSESVAALVAVAPVAPVAALVKSEAALVECKSELSPEDDYDA